jgi:hypothetical protein
MRTKLNLFLGVTLFALLFSCQKEANHDLSNDSGTAVENIGQGLRLSAIPLDECGQYQIKAWAPGNAGTVELLENSTSIAGPQGADIVVIRDLIPGETYTYTVKWYNPNGSPNRSGEFSIKVPGCAEDIECDGSVVLQPEYFELDNICQTYKVAYRVSSCQAQTGLKLQGGLTNNVEKVTGTGSPDGPSNQIDKKNGNSTHTWYFDLDAGVSKTFWVSFTLNTKKAFAGAGPLYPITGAWSVKKNSVPMADYSPRIMVSKCN